MTDMNPNIKVFPSNLFTVHSSDKLSVEESTLGPDFAKRIWQDACDIGFQIKSVSTEVVVTFVLVSQDPHCSMFESYGLKNKINLTVWNT